ncbi:hypothetical protein WKV44_00270 [Spirochaetia bacterium 38H-sp]|uniref:FecR protein domain-containing protein n=1 Tax=Rarispira pelagica TaxID=3141764 RepID=A0ABU9U8H6_9SPIR
MKKIVVFFFLFIYGLSFSFSDNAFGVILYAEGKEFSIYREGNFRTFNISRDVVVGIPVYPGDLVQTSSGTMVEIQVIPGDTMIKVADNTTCEFTDFFPGGGLSAKIAYGRLRVKAENISSSSEIQITGRTFVLISSGGDIGYDFVAAKTGDRITTSRAYVISGSAMVSPVDSSETVELSSSSMFEIYEIASNTANPGISTESKKLDISEELISFWQRKGFVTSALSLDLVQKLYPDLWQGNLALVPRGTAKEGLVEKEGDVAKQSVELYLSSQDAPILTAEELLGADRVSVAKQQRAWGGFLFVTGLFEVGVGVVAGFGKDIAGPVWPYDNRMDTAIPLFATGGISIITGIISYAASFSVSQ